MLYEVKIYDGSGNLVNTVSPAELEKKSTDYLISMLTERDREYIMSLEEDGQTAEMSLHRMLG